MRSKPAEKHRQSNDVQQIDRLIKNGGSLDNIGSDELKLYALAN